ncbi:AsmA family protein [Parvularcula sp. IMCC14364]|uniref:AsmA family protein n=1 Tax=Parvularcula sp. IMCC14364 TaxID=3067902 RepID=UPI002740918F|nr:AsmA family protein [Parvularcula sp. IMCC14364]
MRIITWIVGGIVALGVIGVIALNVIISGGDHKTLIEEQATKALGRTVTVEEVTDSRIFPNPSFGLKGLVIANADGMSDPYFASVGEARIQVKLMPLITSRGNDIQIDGFVLTAPQVNLEKRANGDVNWLLGTSTDAPESEADSETDSAGTSDRDFNLGTVQLTEGKVTYRDGASDQVFIADDADITLTLTSLADPLKVDGTMLFQGEPASLKATVTTPRALMDNTAASINLNFGVSDNTVDTQINLAGGDLAYDGFLDIDAPSLKSLLATLGMDLPVENGFNRLNISGDVSGTGTRMSFSDANITFDEISNDANGTTDIVFDWGGTRPKVSGQIDLTALDLRPYLPEPSEQVTAAKADKNAAFPPWPEDRIDFSPLRAVDVDLKATTESIFLHGMTFGSSGLDFNINNGVLTAALTELNLYDGGGRGTLYVNSRQNSPTVELRNVSLTGMNAQTFATEVLGLSRLSGVGGLDANLSARGSTVADFMRTLSGSGSFAIDKGAVEGVDIGKIVKSASALLDGVQGGNFDVSALATAVAAAQGPASETQFTNLNSSFQVNNGLLQAQNILMQGPFFMIEGNGRVNLPDQSMTMQFVPTVYQTLEAVSGRKLNIPLQVSGTFNQPKVGFDTQGLVRGVVEDRLRGLLGDATGTQLNGEQSIEDNLRGLAGDALSRRLGGGDQDDTAGEENEEEASTEEEIAGALINGLFGNRQKDED